MGTGTGGGRRGRGPARSPFTLGMAGVGTRSARGDQSPSEEQADPQPGLLVWKRAARPHQAQREGEPCPQRPARPRLTRLAPADAAAPAQEPGPPRGPPREDDQVGGRKLLVGCVVEVRGPLEAVGVGPAVAGGAHVTGKPRAPGRPGDAPTPALRPRAGRAAPPAAPTWGPGPARAPRAPCREGRGPRGCQGAQSLPGARELASFRRAAGAARPGAGRGCTCPCGGAAGAGGPGGAVSVGRPAPGRRKEARLGAQGCPLVGDGPVGGAGARGVEREDGGSEAGTRGLGLAGWALSGHPNPGPLWAPLASSKG